MPRTRTSDTLGAIALVALLALGAAADARAVEVTREGAVIRAIDRTGEPGDLRVLRDPGIPDAVLLTSTTGARVTAGAGCVQVTVRRTGVGPDLVACPALGLLDLQFDLGGGADLLFVGPDDPLGPTPYTVTASTGAGHDAVAISAAGAVTADLGAGSDELTVGSTLGPVSVVGGPGRDFLHAGGPAAVVFDGGKGGDLFTSGPAPDRLIGGEGPDRFSFYGRDPELLLTDELQCGPGDDTVDVQPVPGAGVDCPAEIVLPRRARLGDATVGVRVAVGEIARVRLVVYAQRDSGRVDLTRRTTRTLEAGARTLTLRLTDRGERLLEDEERRTARLHVVLADESGDTRDVLTSIELRRP